jgi:mono/diheme cytochrome c family protein
MFGGDALLGAAVALLPLSLATAAQDITAARGRGLAGVVCARCHAVRATGESPMREAPPFRLRRVAEVERQGAGRPEKADDGARQLVQEQGERAGPLLRGDRVRTDACKPSPSLRIRQAREQGGSEAPQSVLRL